MSLLYRTVGLAFLSSGSPGGLASVCVGLRPVSVRSGAFRFPLPHWDYITTGDRRCQGVIVRILQKE